MTSTYLNAITTTREDIALGVDLDAVWDARIGESKDPTVCEHACLLVDVEFIATAENHDSALTKLQDGAYIVEGSVWLTPKTPFMMPVSVLGEEIASTCREVGHCMAGMISVGGNI